MLNYNVIENKPEITIVNGDESNTIYDLLAETYMHTDIDDNPIYVTRDYVARPDLISLAVYGSDKYADLLCKHNGISNPFELNEGMILYCPGRQQLTRYAKNNVGHSDLVVNNATVSGNVNSNGTYKTPIKKIVSSTISATIEAIKTKMKLKSERRSPSEPTVGDSNYVIDRTNGIIIY